MKNISRRKFFEKTSVLGALGYSMAVYAPLNAESSHVTSKYNRSSFKCNSDKLGSSS